MEEETLSDKREVWEEDEKLRKVVYPEEDLKFHIKRLMEKIEKKIKEYERIDKNIPDKFKILEDDKTNQHMRLTASITTMNSQIEEIKKEFGEELTK